ncbi:MAG: hypothetical protein LC798_03870 [Chloroflexi bacterium]|nr:hypothetical protein [Chloroflexota bacterium]
MRIYEGSPRQDWEEVLRSIGAFADSEHLKDVLFLELEGGFLLQGVGMPAGSADSDHFGAQVKRSYELTDDQVGEMMDRSMAKRGSADADLPHTDLLNYYELALRIIGAYIDTQKPHDVFLFEQEGSFVLRLFNVSSARGKHQLSEFTRDEILAMIQSAPEQRQQPAPETTGAQ